MTPKQIAREWLYLLGGLFLPQVFILILWLLNGAPLTGEYCLTGEHGWYPEYFRLLFSPAGHYKSDIYAKILVWVYTLGPYLTFQFFRSIVWAFRTVFIKTKTKGVSVISDEIPLDWETNPEKYDDLPDDIWQKSLSIGQRAYKKDMPYKEWKVIMVGKLSKGVEPFLHRIWYNLRPRPTRR